MTENRKQPLLDGQDLICLDSLGDDDDLVPLVLCPALFLKGLLQVILMALDSKCLTFAVCFAVEHGTLTGGVTMLPGLEHSN